MDTKPASFSISLVVIFHYIFFIVCKLEVYAFVKPYNLFSDRTRRHLRLCFSQTCFATNPPRQTGISQALKKALTFSCQIGARLYLQKPGAFPSFNPSIACNNSPASHSSLICCKWYKYKCTDKMRPPLFGSAKSVWSSHRI
jgi:hypothetical protein